MIAWVGILPPEESRLFIQQAFVKYAKEVRLAQRPGPTAGNLCLCL
jgi:hypothetical protein